MRVLQINTERTWRGGERQTLYTLQGLRDADIEVELLARAHSPLARRAVEAGFTVHSAATSAAALSFLLFRSRSWDILHPQSGKAHSLAILSKPFHHRPVIYTRRVNFVPKGLFGKWKYRVTDRIVAISGAIRDTLNQLDVRRVTVIPSAAHEKSLNRERAEELRRTLKLEGKHIIATTGDLVPQKDPVTMVETIRHLRNLRQDFIFLHFGNTQMRERVLPLIQQYGLTECYLLLGHRDNVEDYFALMDIYLVTGNHTEGLNSSVFDAFLYGVPVVSTLTGGMLDSVADRGLTAPEGDVPQLAAHLNSLLSSPDLARDLTERAGKWVREQVTLPVITERYLELYQSMLTS